MGNSVTSSLHYNCGDKVAFKGSYWTLYEGSRKDASKKAGDDNKVSIFTLGKTVLRESISPLQVAESIFPVANRSVAKLKAIKHPNVLTYIDSTITPPPVPLPASVNGDQQPYIMLITEPVYTLADWLERRVEQLVVADRDGDGKESINAVELQLLHNEILWGFKCILKALEFLHNNVKCTHNYLLAKQSQAEVGHGNAINCCSVYVNQKTGAWKLGNLEFCCTASADDEQFLARHYNVDMLASCSDAKCRSSTSTSGEKVNSSPQRDISALGTVMANIYRFIDEKVSVYGKALARTGSGGIPTALITTLKKMTSATAGKPGAIMVTTVLNNCAALKPNAGVVSSAPKLDSAEGAPSKPSSTASLNVVYLMEYFSELQLKLVSPMDIMNFFQHLAQLSADDTEGSTATMHALLSRSTINSMLLPVIGLLFQHCVVEYNNRNSRELYRQTVLIALQLLCDLANPVTGTTKVSLPQFQHYILPYYSLLFNLSDRLIRTKLLRSLKDLLKHSIDGASLIGCEYVNEKQKVVMCVNAATVNAPPSPGSSGVANAPSSLISLSMSTADNISGGANATIMQCGSIIDNIISGFNDSNAQMREETLKGIVPLLPLLNSANLNDKLVGKYLVTLQQCETESSIRTNCIILIGKIAHMLSDSIRARVLVPCLVKSIRDPFLHCRIAGLKTTLACADMIVDLPSESPVNGKVKVNPANALNALNKLLPAVCSLLLDTNVNLAGIDGAVLGGFPAAAQGMNWYKEERELAMTCINAITSRISTFSKQTLTPYEYQTMISSKSLPTGSAPSLLPRSNNSTGSLTDVRVGAVSVESRSENRSGTGVTQPVAQQSPASSAAPSGSWLSGLTDTLNKSLESATGSSNDVPTVERTLTDTSIAPPAETCSKVQNDLNGAQGNVLGATPVDRNSCDNSFSASGIVAPTSSLNNAWGGDDDLDIDDADTAAPAPATSTAPIKSVSTPIKSAWDDDDVQIQSVSMDDFLNDSAVVQSVPAQRGAASNSLALPLAQQSRKAEAASTSSTGTAKLAMPARPAAVVSGRNPAAAAPAVRKIGGIKKVAKATTSAKADEDWADF